MTLWFQDELKMIVPFMRGGSSEVDQMVDRLENVNAFNGYVGMGFQWEVGEQLEGCCVKEGLIHFRAAKWTYGVGVLLRAEASCKIFSD